MIENTSVGEPSQGGNTAQELSIADIATQLRDLTLDRGKLSKNEILLLFSLPPDRYPDLKKYIAKRFPRELEPGPKRIGGFVAKYHRRGRPHKSELPPAMLELEDWERKTVTCLVELLDHKALEDLLGDLTYTVRRLREIETGESRRGTKEDLANALLIKHGRDLLADKEVRAIIAKTRKLQNPGAWHPGKEAALEFVESCGVPIELAGILSPERQPDYERLEGKVELPPLHDFQQEVHRQILQRLLTKPTRAIATLPTGAGKTRLMVEAVKDYWRTTRAQAVIWLAHTEELCEQAYECFQEVWKSNSDVIPITSVRYWGDYSRTVDTHSHAIASLIDDKVLVVSTPLRLLNALTQDSGRASEFVKALVSAVNVVVIDEAHRAGAPTYRALIDRIREVNVGASYIGLTATPYRTEYANSEIGIAALQKVFEELLEAKSLGNSPRETLQQRGVLARLEIKELKTEIELKLPPSIPVDLNELTLNEQEGVDKVIQAETDSPRRRLAILPYIRDAAKDPQSSILYFGPTVNDAQAMTFLLRMSGLTAAFVGSGTRTPTRRRIIQEFRERKIKVICNCEVLTTGFDAPRVTHIVIARPTVSRVLWEQMIGRGLRGEKFGGTTNCVLYDCVDNFQGDLGKVKGFTEYRDSWRKEMGATQR